MLPDRGPAVIGVVIVAIAAFSLGLLLSGGGSSPDSMTNHDHAEEDQAGPTTWTCSMHPQFKLPKEGKCPICFMDLIPLETGSGDELDPNQIRMSETAKQLARIQVTPVRRAYGEAEIRLVGKIAYDETKVAYITAWVPGRLDRLYADFTGITVSKGDHLVSIYSPELLAAQEELLQARSAVAALTNASSRVLKSTAEATLEASREKLRLYGLRNEQIEEIESTGKTSDHLTIYSPTGGVVVHKNALEGMYVSTGTQIYTISDLSRLWAVFEAYESDLPWLRYGQRVSFTSTSFPGETFDAIISFINPVVDARTRTVQVRAIVDNPEHKLKPDMFVRAIIESRIDDKGKVIDENLAGKWISPMHPEIVKDHPGACDVCGMPLVKAESLGYASRRGPDENAPLVIPISAPLITGKRAVVYVEIPNDEGPIFEGREIELGPRAGDFYIVKSGLEEGELVVTNGTFKIDSELQIQAKPSMMSPEGGASTVGHQHGQSGSTGSAASTAPSAYKAGTAERMEVSKDALADLSPVYDSYFEAQMALANDDPEAATKAYENLANRVDEVDMSLFTGKGHDRWMAVSRVMKTQASKGKSAKDIVAARDAFFHLSNAIIELHDTFGHAVDQDYFLTFCPMARDSKGAFWLQTVDTVYNSFYGASMLRCGKINETLGSEKTGTE
jgi:Cu(I)/Ag(I) efflux system membrane fusion protein